MKRYIPLAVITLLVIAASGAGYWIYSIESSVFIATEIDITDPSKIHIDTSEAMNFYKAKSAFWGQTTIELQAISELQYNQVYRNSLSAQFPLVSNPYERQAQIETFYADITSHMQAIAQADAERGQSSIYSGMVRELNLMEREKAHFKFAVFYTDCQENTDAFSIYRSNDAELVKKHPDKVTEILSQFGTIGSLQGITIYFIYQPKSPEDEERFLLMANFLKELFEEHGARVVIRYNLTL